MDDPPWPTGGTSSSSTAATPAGAAEEEVHEDEVQEKGGEDEDEGEEGTGCAHYRRRCRIVAPCCGEIFWCRHCHNEEKNTGECETSHEIDRRLIREVVCQTCGIRVESAQYCSSCGECFAEYFCSVCNFWDDEGEAKQVFHCDECGICRVGGRDNFVHCGTCASCYPVECADFHTCVEQAMHQNCPVCMENLFQSTAPVRVLCCGHTIHQDCLQALQMSFAGLQSLRCPICNMSLNKHDELWEELDRQIRETPMPAEYRDMYVEIMCNDCQTNAEVLFHIIGHKCLECGSYNTRRE